MMGFSCILASCVSCTIWLIIKKQNTPIVKSSHFLLTMTQLLTQLLLSVTLPFLFIGDPNDSICYLRPITTGVLLSVKSIITTVKINYILFVFQSKTNITSRRKYVFKKFTIVCSHTDRNIFATYFYHYFTGESS